MTRNQKLAIAVGLLISAVFLFIAFNGLNPALVLQSIGSVNPVLLAVGAVWYFAAVAVISIRWGFLLRSTKAVPFQDLFRLVCIGYMGNNVYPLRAGEALRIYLLQRNNGIPMARSTTVVIVERVFDGLVMLTFIVAALAVTNIASPQIETVFNFAAPLFGLALVVFFVLAARPDWMARLVSLLARALPGGLGEKVQALGNDVIDGLKALRSPANLIGAVLASYISWMLEASVYWIVSFAFNLNIDYGTALLVVGVVNLAGLIPASPGQIGVYEFFVRTVLIAALIPETTAVAYALTVHVVIWLPVTVVGFFFLIRQGMGGFGGALARAREVEQAAA
jgi:hypothetical protein